MKKGYSHTVGRNAVILICNFTSRGMDLLQCAASLSAALGHYWRSQEAWSFSAFPHCRVLLEGDGLVQCKPY